MMGFAIALSRFEYGLIYGFLIGHFVTTFILTGFLWKPFVSGARFMNTRRFWFWVKKNRGLPSINGPAAFVSSMAGNLPVFLITAWFGSHHAGLYAMLMRILGAPIQLISVAISKVATQDISLRINKRQPIFIITKKITARVFMLAPLLAVGIIFLGAFELFSILFGENWAALNSLSLYFMPCIVIGFASKCLPIFAIYKKNMLGLKYQFFLIVMTYFALLISYAVSLEFKYALLFLSITLSVVYVVKIGLIFMLSKAYDLQFKVYDDKKNS